MSNILQFPEATPDVTEMEIDGNPEMMLSARGLVLFCLSSWRLDGNQKAHDCLRRYCEHISAHGYRGGASKALADLDGLSNEEAKAWIRRTYARYVVDGGRAMIQYMMGGVL